MKQDLNSKISRLINIPDYTGGKGGGLGQIYCLSRKSMAQLQLNTMKNYFNLLLHSDFDRVLFNFRLSLQLEPLTLGPRARLEGQKHPPHSMLLSTVKMSF